MVTVENAPVTSTGKPGDANMLDGDFGEFWLQVVASGVGMGHGRPTTLDLEKADVELVLREEVCDTYHPSVKAQVKTTRNLVTDGDGNILYDLEVDTYNVLRRSNCSYRRILVVIGLSDQDGRFRVHGIGTTLLGRGAWVSLEGMPNTTNSSKLRVKLPAVNALDADGLRTMLRTFGVRNSTPVPSIHPWGEVEE